VLPSIAANGGVTIWLWIIFAGTIFWPQGIAVIELAQRYPGEGGVYLWAKEVFRQLPRVFIRMVLLTNNMMYVPTVLLYSSASSVFALAPGTSNLPTIKSSR